MSVPTPAVLGSFEPAAPSRDLFIEPRGEEVIRGELYGPDRLESYARSLAAASSAAAAGRRVRPLLDRFEQNRRILTDAYARITNATEHREHFGADAEWLLDNFHIVTDALREIYNDLPHGYHTELPKLVQPPLGGYPRIYALAMGLCAHTDSSLDEAKITRCVQAYQSAAPLTIGELWAVPTMLRVCLIENLRRLASQMLEAWSDRLKAQDLAKRLARQEANTSHAPALLAGLFPTKAALSGPLAANLLQALRQASPVAAAAAEWVENHLRTHRTDSTELFRREHRRQASNQVSIGNCVTSLRLLSALDWTVFFERTSLVEAVLRDDPAGIYARQEFVTKDRYRRIVEHLARGSRTGELDVARKTLMLANRHRTPTAEMGDAIGADAQAARGEKSDRVSTSDHSSVLSVDGRRAHVGYYLIDDGRNELERELGYTPKFREKLLRGILDHSQLVYFGSLAISMGLLLCVVLFFSGALEVAVGALILTLMVSVLPASDVAVALVNHLVTWLVPPRVLPRLDFKDGLPASCSTFIVMPAMLVRPESAALLLGRLEVHFLSNPESHFYYALLTDFADAPAAHMPEDANYLRAAVDGIRALNARHCHEGPERFFLFHRSRTWNPVQSCWMGWERKRGKLLEFNRLLRGARDTSYADISCDLDQIPVVRYVLTLDADTQLPRESARRLVATIAHPLNRARFDPEAGRVVEGYGVLQPRVSLRLTSGPRSLFSRVYSGSAGLDPYTTAVSDVYQDLFGRGSFIGKGIYDVDGFEAAVGGTFPQNCILSHDLIEGNYARCALVTDIELLDDFPERYHAYALRQHRWARGDWQILPWLFPRVPAGEQPSAVLQELPSDTKLPQGSIRNPLPAVERWKIADNLRRTLVPPSIVLLLIVSWLNVLPGSPWLWTAVAVAVLGMPLLVATAGALLVLSRDKSPRDQVRALRTDLGSAAAQVFLNAAFLADQARLLADAIVRSLYRLFVSRKRLLEWETAAAAERRLGAGLANFWTTMWLAPAFSVSLALVLVLTIVPNRPEVGFAAAPFLFLWLLSPWIAFWTSRPRLATEAPLSESERKELRYWTRKTWAFFETYVNAESHWLPPDNFQEDPKEQLAQRTSPTNIGMFLLSALAAHDLGYLTLPALLDLLEKTFQTLDHLEKFQNHFHNWYDTTTLLSLRPSYISTVDSGNLAGCLLVLKQGLLGKAKRSVSVDTARAGLEDTFEVLQRLISLLVGRDSRTVLNGRSSQTHMVATDPSVFQPIEESVAALAEMFQESSGDLAAWSEWLERLRVRTSRLVEQLNQLAVAIHEELPAIAHWAGRLHTEIEARQEELGESDAGAARLTKCQKLADRADAMVQVMNFRFLYNEQRHLFSTGYNLATGRLDNSHYDLLASEARLASFLAIALGQAGQKHWFQLGRPMTMAGGNMVLLSWGGTMFEYLMPQLFLRSYAGTILDDSCRGCVAEQIAYGKRHQVPWGISESAYAALDSALDYRYQSFGVPSLGLKRGLGLELVVAPYATALAAMMRPGTALENLRRLRAAGAEGPFGFYEALDYTKQTLLEQRNSPLVRSYMAHHQGMILVALTNCLLDSPMVRRLEQEPMIRATDLLLQEKSPRSAPIIETDGEEAVRPRQAPAPNLAVSRRLTTPSTPSPRTHLLSNGHYRVMVTNAGAGCSRCREIDVTRWREDRTCDSWGQFCYVRDLRTGLLWSAGHQPICRPADEFQVVYSADKAEFYRSDAGLRTLLEIAVAPDSDAEIRRVTLTNHTSRTHDLELTSYAELVLGPHADDLAHPAFGKLFLETELAPLPSVLLCRRRPRAEDEKAIWAVHLLAVEGTSVGHAQHETDRARFLGRNRTPANPAALEPGSALSGRTGAVLDPIFSLRQRVRVVPGASVSVSITTGVAFSREEALGLADRYRDVHAITRAFELAWAHSQLELRHLQISAEDAHLYQRIAAHLCYAGSVLRAPFEALAHNRQGQPGLWRHGISGDLPIALACISEPEDLALVGQLLAAHAFWRLKGLPVDLVILNERSGGYLEEFQEQIQILLRANSARALADKPGGVFICRASHMSEADKLLLQAAARVVFSGRRGSLASLVDEWERPADLPSYLPVQPRPEHVRRQDKMQRALPAVAWTPDRTLSNLAFANGFGGFSPDGREYIISPLTPSDANPSTAAKTPAPWINVVANNRFGFLISESGAGYTWNGNSQTNRLTPWNNDPVSDPPGEAVYLRDEETGVFWSPTPSPEIHSTRPEATEDRRHCCRHGQGYTVFECASEGLEQEMLLFVPVDDPIKIIRVRIRNQSGRRRRLTATFFVEWVLTTTRDRGAMNVLTEVDDKSGALLARNWFNEDFASQVAFADVSIRPRTLTADRTEFLGRNGSVAAPAALGRVSLSGRAGAALDPCAALQAPLELAPGESQEVVFLLGQASDVDAVRRLVQQYCDPQMVEQALSEVHRRWDETLTTIQVQTPDRAMDFLLNRWLLYQVLGCRVWARSEFYQSGGAYGFRDQLQDVMALVYGARAETRNHILRAASRQFEEGDVQHWWHPPAGRGVRTRFSDDFLWLPYVVYHYVNTTGDRSILDEKIGFLTGPALRADQEEDYGVPAPSEANAVTVYEHCLRALDHGCRFGVHGLPLMGTGDWNDGMNRVGAGGKGESVWVGWFLGAILRQFVDLVQTRGDSQRATQCTERAERLRRAIEDNAWDGAWYRRAYFDDGTPLGSAQNDECRIDSIAQTWAVISGEADADRARRAMAAVDEQLVRRADRLILLFTPPFDRGDLHPGYIKGYVPGIRENAGQYTHAATWVVQAFAMLGQGNRAVELFDLLNPILNADRPQAVERYRVEPYVVAADVYSEAPYVGRGGWTWYTGSAGWLYRVGLEWILGFRLRGNRLTIDPCISSSWHGYTITYRYGAATYEIRVENPDGVERGVKRMEVDGSPIEGCVSLSDDGRQHRVRVILGA
jgi:cyclic beta-1,2-glucan synthetase